MIVPFLNIPLGRHSIVPRAPMQGQCGGKADGKVEADWTHGYDEVHLPDALACPGWLSGRRYLTSGEIAESDRGQSRRTKARLYTTVYELESPAAVTTKEFAAMRGWSRF